MAKAQTNFIKRRARVRRSLAKVANGRPRLSVFRSGRHIYAQVIDDTQGHTVASASTLDKDIAASGSNKDGAAKVGEIIAKRAQDAGVKEVIFDRGGYIYHGRVKALADAAREAGLSF